LHNRSSCGTLTQLAAEVPLSQKPEEEMQMLHYLLACVMIIAACGSTYAATTPHIGLNDVVDAVEKSFRQVNGPLNPATRITEQLAPPIATFSANFFQRTILAGEQRELRADGQVSVKFPDGRQQLMYRFEYFRPSRQEIVSDGRSLWIYHPENREVMLADLSPLYNNFTREPAVNFLQGLHRISRDFLINFAGGMYDSAGNYVLELQPRRAMLDTRLIVMVVNRTSVEAFKNTKPEDFNKPSSVPSPRTQGAVPQPRSPFGGQAPFGPAVSDPFPILSTTVYSFGGDSTTIEFSNVQVNARMSDMDFNFLIPPGVQVVRPNERMLPPR
jgi:outer membrane lipoprotein-sorting protein